MYFIFDWLLSQMYYSLLIYSVVNITEIILPMFSGAFYLCIILHFAYTIVIQSLNL